MQTQLPFFPSQTRLFNAVSGVIEKDGLVIYLHNGSPIFCHDIDDKQSYRLITANLVQNKLCKPSEIARVFGVSARSIQINTKNLREKGIDWFLYRQETRGKCYKFNDAKFEEAQKLLNEDKSNKEIARRLEVSESSIRYHIRAGKLKKKKP
jgi:transposase